MAIKRVQVARFTDLHGGPWQIEITDRGRLAAALGEPLLIAFCRCFVHADRINSLSCFFVLSIKVLGEKSVAHERNLQTMFWFVAGTLLELRRAVQDLEKELKAASLMSPRLKGWRTLRELQTWTRGKLLWRVRNKIAYHADSDEIRAGLKVLLASRDRWLLIRGDDNRMVSAQVPFGTEPLLKGLRISKRDMLNFIRGAAKRQLRIPSALQDLFKTILQRRGLDIGH